MDAHALRFFGRLILQPQQPTKRMNTTTKTVAQFIADHGITMTVQRAISNPSMTDKEMDHWHCTFRMDGRFFSTPFSTGVGLRERDASTVDLPSWEVYLARYERTENSARIRARYNAAVKAQMIPVDPSADSVLDCMASDCSGFDEATKFEDWAGEFGYDADSRKALATFETVKAEYRNVRQWLGEELFTELLETERL